MAGFSVEGKPLAVAALPLALLSANVVSASEEMTLSSPRPRIVHCTRVRGTRRGAWDG